MTDQAMDYLQMETGLEGISAERRSSCLFFLFCSGLALVGVFDFFDFLIFDFDFF